jgi:hypothetical protein
MGINFSNNSSLTQSRPSGLIHHYSASLDSHSAYTVSNLPNDNNVRFIQLDFSRLAVSGSAAPRYYMRFGNGSVDSGNNYRFGAGYFDGGGSVHAQDGTSYLQIVNQSHTNSNHRECGVLQLHRTNTYGWSILAQFADTYYSPICYQCTGFYFNNNPITHIKLQVNSGSFRYSSRMLVSYSEGYA